MRLWTLHPKYLDRQGFLAVWREGLLAKHVLEQWTVDPEKRIAYGNHPQLDRFKITDDPVAAISLYLAGIFAESQRRKYSFDRNKFDIPDVKIIIPTITAEIEFERNHLLQKLIKRDPQAADRLRTDSVLQLHSLFAIAENI
ncbi:MAG: pyrimidine dimer DNA glycosylase/endonuclease V [Planctomycetia bacterium]|nr:pyrimidine dimer DNA glycosylase/endonuclease V [Planctomycetia bacterium]